MSLSRKDGGPAFPIQSGVYRDLGMTLRNYFAAHAPAPSEREIELQQRFDNSRNPHNDSHKPKIRSRKEIIASLAFEHADAMIAAGAVLP